MRSMNYRNALFSSAILVSLIGIACSQFDETDNPRDDPEDIAQPVLSGPLAKLLGEEFDKHYVDNQGLTYEQWVERHELDYGKGLDFSVKDAAFYDKFASTFAFDQNVEATLAEHGFAVVPWNAGHGDVLYRVFAADLPIFITADAILHAWHRSFDKLLEQTEVAIMIPTLQALLAKTMGALETDRQADNDALFYLAVSRKLLDPEYEAPKQVKKEVNRILEYIEGKQIEEIQWMGQKIKMDFSQFIPRGHYTNSEDLKRYFRSMMWLGRTDLVLYDPNFESPREEAAARALAQALSRSGATAEFDIMDLIYLSYVGKTNALTPVALLELCARAGLVDCQGAGADMVALYQEQAPPDYSSRITSADVPPISMRFFPQRFAYDAWVTSQTTSPRLKPAEPGGRTMAMPEDVAFSLGSDRAARFFHEDMTRPYRQNLPATLAATRATMESILPVALEPTVYNHWLEALMAASRPTVDPSFPQVMQTATWHDHKIETVLASWSEMRHDTILIVEQSTGSAGCQYPKGYVEPVTELYASIGDAATTMSALYTQLSNIFPGATDFFEHWVMVMTRLEQMSEQELLGQPFRDEQLAFLNDTVDLHREPYLGERSYNGWYPSLYWVKGWKKTSASPEEENRVWNHPSGESEPIVADVHTDAFNGLALEVGTAHPGIMFIAIDNGGDLSMYAGPVSSYYSLNVPVSGRLTDEQWVRRIDAGNLPPHPEFAKSYWVDDWQAPNLPEPDPDEDWW